MTPEDSEFPPVSTLDQFDEIAVLRSFFDDAPAFFVIKDSEGRYVYVNRYVATAQKRSDLIGKSAHDLQPPALARAMRERELQVLSTGVPLHSREVFPGLDGKLLSASLIRFPIETPSQRLLAVIGFDVTEIARAQARQAALLDLATDAIHVRDLAGRITYWNRAAERLYGWTAAEAQGRNALEILVRQDAQSAAAMAEIQSTFLREGAWSGELSKVTRGGGDVIVASRWTLLRDHNERPDAMLVIDSDITQKKQMEQELLRAVRIDTIGSLAGGVAHDLNNMLMPILMGAAVIRRRVSDPQLARTVDQLEQSARKAADLVRQILTFIRGSRDAKATVSAEQLFADLRQFLTTTSPPSLRIEYHLGENLAPVVCRPSEVHQVLVNLCVNARDAMEDSGALVLSAKNAVIDASYARTSATPANPGRYLALAVTDSGKGITPDQRAHVFEPYFTTKDPGKGTGLGLSNAASVVRDLGGFITVESEPGRSTTFTILLPAAEGAPSLSESAASIPGGNGETILVVDDEGAVVEVVRETLEAFGYRVVTASDGSEAIAILATQSDTVRVIVTDVAMPIVDGIALAKFARRTHPGLKIVIASGTNDPMRREAMELGHAYLQKPYTADMLLRLVAELLSSKE